MSDARSLLASAGAELRAAFGHDRYLQHEALFARRHEDASPEFHRSLVEGLWSTTDRSVILGFRGSGKSTRAEEMVALAACEGRFKNCLFIGPSETRAAERLAAISNELKTNELLIGLYGDQVSEPWTQTKLVLKNGACIQAMGRDQDIRGIKHIDWRPDLVVVDDFEDKDAVLTPEGRRKTLRWFLRELRPACDPRCKMRVLATIMDADCIPLQLVRAGWPEQRYPISHIDAAGEPRPIWPARFPLDWVDREREEYGRLGEAGVFEMEMMCQPEGQEGGKDFDPSCFRIEPRVRVWEPVWAAIDPARTTRRATSASTGIVVFSWVGTELVVWEDRTGFYKPSEMIEHLFQIEERYSPVAIGFEENGLEEWALEPIRAESMKRGVFLPLQPLRAPRDKLSFIRGLEPHARSGEIVFAQPMPELAAQFASFPRGRIDGPNALAYAKVMRPGLPVYDGFVPTLHVADHVIWPPGEPLWLALGATGAYVTGALIGASFGRVAVIADWLREGDPGAVAPDLVREALMTARTRVNIIAGPEHFNEWNNVGLAQAVRHIPAEIRQGGSAARGRETLRRDLDRLVRDIPAFRVDASARWTLAALAAGYARKPGKPEPEPGFHRTLMEAIESCLGLMSLGLADEDSANFAFTARGQRYRRYASAFERLN